MSERGAAIPGIMPLHEPFSPADPLLSVSQSQTQAQVQSPKLFIGGLSYDTTDASLANYFSQYGEVSSAIVLRDPVTSHSRGFGFVTFANVDGARNVLAHSRNHVVDGRKVEAKVAVPKSQSSPTQRTQQSPPMNNIMPGYGYGMNMHGLNMGMGMDPYSQTMNGGMASYDYQNPMYNSQLNANADVYSSMMSFSQQQTRLYETPQIAANRQSLYNKQNQSNVHEVHRRDDSLRAHMDAKMRNFSISSKRGEQDRLGELTGSLNGLGLGSRDSSERERQDEHNSIVISGLSEQTSKETLHRVFSSFGEISSVDCRPEGGYAVIKFVDSSSVDEVISYQRLNGHLVFDGKEVRISLGVGSSSTGRFVRRINSTPMDHDLIFERSSEAPAAKPRFLGLRTKSVAQSMLLQTPDFEDDDFDFHKQQLLMRDDKMRSLSMVGGSQPHPFQRINSESGYPRRSSLIHQHSESQLHD